MNKIGNISPRQAFFLILILLNGIFYLMLPRQLVNEVGSMGWLALMLGLGAAIAIIGFITGLGRRYADKSIVQYAPLILGKALGYPISLVLLLYFAMLAVGSLRIFAELLNSALLPETPRLVLIGSLVLLVYWVVQNGLEDIARVTEFLSPFIIFLLFLALLGNIQYADISRLKPVVFIEWWKIGRGILSTVSYFGLVVTLLMLFPFIKPYDRVARMGFFVVVTGGLISGVTYLSLLTTFGVEETARMAWPVLEMVRMVRISSFLERLDALFLAVWLTTAFLNASLLSFCFLEGTSQLLGYSYRKLTLPVLGIFMVITLLPPGLIQVLNIYRYLEIYGFVITLGIPLLLFLVSSIKKGGKHGADKNR